METLSELREKESRLLEEDSPSYDAGDLAVECKSVCKTYLARDGLLIDSLRDVNFSARPFEFVSIVGPSGCGKSTLLKLIANLLEPTNGEIAIFSHPPSEAKRARSFGIVFQDPVLLPWRTALENAALLLEITGLEKQERWERARKLLDLVGLSGFYHNLPFELSGGMQQRVGIARALSLDPHILLMDEPFGALDEITRDRMNQELLDLWEKTKKTILFVTHSIPEAVYLSDRVVVLTPRPGTVRAMIDIRLPRPRREEVRDSPIFTEYLRYLRSVIRE